MRGQVGKWGNSLALRIPSSIAREVALEEGTPVSISVDTRGIIVARLEAEPVYDHDELVAAITDENRHAEIRTGKAVGNEFA
jgi:antitoxin MazE